MSNLDELCIKLSIDDDDTEAYLDEKGTDEIHHKKASCLAARMLVQRPYHIDAIKTTFLKVWQLSNGLEIKETSKQNFLFYFDDPMVRAKVWLRQPWSFNKSLMVFTKFAEDGAASRNSSPLYDRKSWISFRRKGW